MGVKKKRGKPDTDWRTLFCDALAETPNVTLAAEKAGVSRTQVYRTRGEEEVFASAWIDALRLGIEALEDKAFDLAKNGWEEPVYQQCMLVGHIRRYDTRLMIQLLKAHKPTVYALPERHEHAHAHFGLADLVRLGERGIAAGALPEGSDPVLLGGAGPAPLAEASPDSPNGSRPPRDGTGRNGRGADGARRR